MTLYRCNACGLEGDNRDLDGECPRDRFCCRVEPDWSTCRTHGCREIGVGFSEDDELLCADCLFEATTAALFGQEVDG